MHQPSLISTPASGSASGSTPTPTPTPTHASGSNPTPTHASGSNPYPWIYHSKPLTEIPLNTIGFVYQIYNHQSKKFYIGKKLFHFQKTIQKNNKKKKIKIESDWKLYNGSNKNLLNDIIQHNPILTKNILYLCYSKSQCSYLELKEQIINDAILSPHYYNDWISAKITRNHMAKFQLTLD